MELSASAEVSSLPTSVMSASAESHAIFFMNNHSSIDESVSAVFVVHYQRGGCKTLPAF
jgi:hypothetical protein